MIGIDTNILVRFFTQDEPRQAALARRLINDRLTREEPGHVAALCIAELAWVLSRSYDIARDEILEVIDGLLAAPTLMIEHRAALRQALLDARRANVDLADALIARINLEAGCSRTFTFDRSAARLDSFELLS